MILTNEINRFREAARHLWNSYLITDATWDTVETFGEICRALYEDQIIRRLNISAPPIPVYGTGNPIDSYLLSVGHKGKLPVIINRDNPPSGYWDYPLEWIPPEENPIIFPISFFDFDCLGWRDLEFYLARIQNCPSHPEINGRDALIKCEYVQIKFVEKGGC